MAATGIRWDFGPVVAVPQDVRWGRAYEGYGEDPRDGLGAGDGVHRGPAGRRPDGRTASAAATAKHFVGDGGTAWGSSTTPGYSIDQGVNPASTTRPSARSTSPRTRPPSRRGARIVMASFSSTGAGKVHGDRHLLTDVLKGELGFTGFVVSDWAGVDQVDPDYDDRRREGDLGRHRHGHGPVRRHRASGDAVKAGLAAGTITPARIDDAVDPDPRASSSRWACSSTRCRPRRRAGRAPTPTARSRARRSASRRSCSRRPPGVLPLRPGDVLLAGSGADDIGLQSGGWTISWQGSPGPTTPGTTIADDLRAAARRPAHRHGRPRDPRGHPRRRPASSSSPSRRMPRAWATPRRWRSPRTTSRRSPRSGRMSTTRRRDPVRPAGDARPDPAGRRRRRGRVAARHGGRRRRRRAVRGPARSRRPRPYTWPTTPDDAPRTGKARVRRRGVPAGLRPGRRGSAARTGRLPRGPRPARGSRRRSGCRGCC